MSKKVQYRKTPLINYAVFTRKNILKFLIIVTCILSGACVLAFGMLNNTANYPTLYSNETLKKVFVSPKYDFSFKYPQSLFTVPSNTAEFDKNSKLILKSNIQSDTALTLNIISTNGTSLSSQKNDFLYPRSKNVETEITLDGLKAYAITQKESNDKTILFENDDYIFSISKGDLISMEIFDSIIDSFRFTK